MIPVPFRAFIDIPAKTRSIARTIAKRKHADEWKIVDRDTPCWDDLEGIIINAVEKL